MQGGFEPHTNPIVAYYTYDTIYFSKPFKFNTYTVVFGATNINHPSINRPAENKMPLLHETTKNTSYMNVEHLSENISGYYWLALGY